MPDEQRSVVQLYGLLPENERIITDILRQIILSVLPSGCKEKLSFGVPYFYGKKGICIVWPATIPRGGIRKGVLLLVWQPLTGHRKLPDPWHQQAGVLQNISIAGRNKTPEDHPPAERSRKTGQQLVNDLLIINRSGLLPFLTIARQGRNI